MNPVTSIPGESLAAVHHGEVWAEVLNPRLRALAEADELLDLAWGVIANASDWNGGTPQQQTWRVAAVRWRDRYHEHLTRIDELTAE